MNLLRRSLGLLALFVNSQVMAIEQPAYTLIETRDAIELRRYEPVIVAETIVDQDMKRAGNTAFRKLAGYIFGGNARSEKFAMTSPVIQQPAAGAGYRVSFFMSKRATLDEMPVPDDEAVSIRELPEQIFAALRYRGGWSVDRYTRHVDEIMAYLDTQDDIEVVGDPVWARYDAPFVPPPFRTNEVLVPVAYRAGEP